MVQAIGESFHFNTAYSCYVLKDVFNIYRQEREYFVPRCCPKNGAFCAVVFLIDHRHFANLLKAKFQPMFRASAC